MTDWTSGYTADIGYTYGYYNELNPIRSRLAFLHTGLFPPSLGNHCELGFGQGMSVNLHAAASSSAWHSTDFNPSQASFAQELAKASGANAHLHDQSFAEFCARDDLPMFDSIGLHGIWSWISDENRAIIVDFVRRKLVVGGVLYISYNTQPGWASMVPLRDLLTEHTAVLGQQGHGIVHRIDAALEFAERLLATNPGYARANPQVADRIKRIKGQSRNYLAHEYFNRDWTPMSIARMATWLTPAKLSYACSASFLDHIDAISLSPEQQALLKEIPDPMFRQTVRDFCTNQQFRKDYWVKGIRSINAVEQAEALRLERFILTVPRSSVPNNINGSVGKITLQDAIYQPLLDALADHKIHTFAELEKSLKDRVQHGQLVSALMILCGMNCIQPAQSDTTIESSRSYCSQLNAALMKKAEGQTDLAYLASPVTGGGIDLNRIEQLFLSSVLQGKKQSSKWAQHVWTILQRHNQRLIRDGKIIETDEDNLKELTKQAETFATKRLPILQALQIA